MRNFEPTMAIVVSHQILQKSSRQITLLLRSSVAFSSKPWQQSFTS